MKLVIYMKSGNQIKIRGIRGYKIENRGDEIVGVTIERWWWARGQRLLVKTLALSQVEAVCVV
jgi:hypothetical protein